MRRATFVSSSAAETRELGRTMAEALEPGDTLVLTGDLGAGKTQLTKGIAEGLGVAGEVTSPTFALEAVHEGGRMPLYHFDLYRLHDADELGDAGVWDVLGTDGVCVFEWGEQFAGELGDERVDVLITREEDGGVGPSDGTRPSGGTADSAAHGAVCPNDAASEAEPVRRIELVSHETRGDAFVAAVARARGAELG